MTENAKCKYCEYGAHIINHNGKDWVRVIRVMVEEPYYALEMSFHSSFTGRRFEYFEPINFCPVCGRDLRNETCQNTDKETAARADAPIFKAPDGSVFTPIFELGA